MKGCARARQRLLAGADQELALDERLLLDAHLARCASCRAERDALAALEQGLALLPEPPVESLDLDRAVAAVRARVAAGPAEEPALPRGARADLRRAPRPYLLGAAAAAAAALLLWALLGRNGAPEPTSTGNDALGAAPAPALRSDAPVDALPAHDGTADGALANGDRPNDQLPDDALANDALPQDAFASELANGGPATERLAVEAPPQGAEAGATLSGEALDPARLAAARASVAEELARAFAGVAPLAARPEVEAAAARFDADTAELARAWPRLRLVQGLAGEVDPALAAAGLRYLGVRGDAIAAGALRDALDRSAAAPVAVAALGDLGAEGLPGLAQALRRPELAAEACQRVAALGGERAAAVLLEALERHARARARRGAVPDELDAKLLAALAALRPCPAAELLALVQRGELPRAAALDALAQAEGAGDALSALAAGGDPRVDAELLLAALSVVRPAAALPFVEEQATERRARDAAHDCLAAYADAGALEVLARLRASGRARAELVLDATARLLAANPEAGADLARRAVAALDAGPARELQALLLEVGARDAAPGLSVLATSRALPADERCWAALALGELGGAESAAALVGGLARLAPGEERLAAAFLLSASALGAREAALSALAGDAGLEPRLARRLAELCDARGDETPAVTLYRVARELEPVLEDRSRTQAAGAP